MAVEIGPQDGPDEIVPKSLRKQAFAQRSNRIIKKFTTKDGLFGNYDYAFLFRPNLPFMEKSRRVATFFGLNQQMPVVLALLLGFQHALAMLAGIITPPMIIASAAGFSTSTTQYLVSTALVVSGFLSALQITRFHLKGTPYYFGTGLISVVITLINCTVSSQHKGTLTESAPLLQMAHCFPARRAMARLWAPEPCVPFLKSVSLSCHLGFSRSYSHQL